MCQLSAEPAAPVELSQEADKLADELDKIFNAMLAASSEDELQQLQMRYTDLKAKEDRVNEMRKALAAQLTGTCMVLRMQLLSVPISLPLSLPLTYTRVMAWACGWGRSS